MLTFDDVFRNGTLLNIYIVMYFENGRFDDTCFLSVIMIDIDNLKIINDTYGHRRGDLVLAEIAHRISSICRSEDIVARIGGEEFMILLENINIEKAEVVTERIRKIIEETKIEDIHVTISLGTTKLKENDSSITIFERVDAALYEAKHIGKNCFVVK